ncbi:MAG: hypothetical protein ACLUZ0_08200 [Coprococcus sp.]
MKKEQIEEIISKMTLHEKVLLCTGKNSWRTRDYEKLGIPSILVSDGTSGVRFQIGSDQPEEMSFYDSLGGSFDNEEAMSRHTNHVFQWLCYCLFMGYRVDRRNR